MKSIGAEDTLVEALDQGTGGQIPFAVTQMMAEYSNFQCEVCSMRSGRILTTCHCVERGMHPSCCWKWLQKTRAASADGGQEHLGFSLDWPKCTRCQQTRHEWVRKLRCAEHLLSADLLKQHGLDCFLTYLIIWITICILCRGWRNCATSSVHILRTGCFYLCAVSSVILSLFSCLYLLQISLSL